MKELLTHQDICNNYYFGARNTVYKYLREDGCPSIKIKGKWFVDKDEFLEWYKARCIEKKAKKERNLKMRSK